MLLPFFSTSREARVFFDDVNQQKGMVKLNITIRHNFAHSCFQFKTNIYINLSLISLYAITNAIKDNENSVLFNNTSKLSLISFEYSV